MLYSRNEFQGASLKLKDACNTLFFQIELHEMKGAENPIRADWWSYALNKIQFTTLVFFYLDELI